MTAPWLLIDVSWLAHRARHTMQGLEHDDQPTGVVFGFLEQLKAIAFNPRLLSNKVAFFFDSRQSHRKVQWPPYKEKRHQDRTPEELAELKVMHEQVEILRSQVLPAVGFPCLRQTGLESDDLMGWAAFHLFEWNEKAAVMITADGDLYQCITQSVHWYDPNRDLYLDPIGFVRKKGPMDPVQWARVKAIGGCSSDAVPGVPGVGEASAIAYVLGLLPSHHKRYRDIESPEGKAVIHRNMGLVVIPHPKTKPFKLESPAYDRKAFFAACREFGIKSYLEGTGRREWEAFFRGDMDSGRQVPRKRGEDRAKRKR